MKNNINFALILFLITSIIFVGCSDKTVLNSDTIINNNSSELNSSVIVSSNESTDTTSSFDTSDLSQNSSQSDDYIIKLTTIADKAAVYKIGNDIYKIDAPVPGISSFGGIFIVKNNEDYFIIDTGSNEGDIENYFIPATEFLNIPLHKVKSILITHNHFDHAGGLPTLLGYCGRVTIYGMADTYNAANNNPYVQVSDGDIINGIFSVVDMKGHSFDSCGYIDNRSNTLFSGDGIQLYGINSAGMYIFYGVDNYMKSLKNLLNYDIENILATHPYCPNGAFAIGKEQSRKHIEDSINYTQELIDFTLDLYDKGISNPLDIKKSFIEHKKSSVSDFPYDGFEDAIKSIINIYA